MKLKDFIQELQDIARDHGEDIEVFTHDVEDGRSNPIISAHLPLCGERYVAII